MSTTRPKAVYALYYAALACLIPFMTLYYQQKLSLIHILLNRRRV